MVKRRNTRRAAQSRAECVLKIAQSGTRGEVIQQFPPHSNAIHRNAFCQCLKESSRTVLSPDAILFLATLLICKHFLADGPLQSQYQLANKGQFLHWGGLLHAATHAGLTALCLALSIGIFSGGLAKLNAMAATIWFIVSLEFCVHYTIDWVKCRLEKTGGWSESTRSESGQRQLLIKNDRFFHAFLADQMLHSLTYVAVIFIVGSGS